MPHKPRKPRIVALLAVATLTLAVMAPAMASQPDDVPPAQAENVDGETVGADKATAGQAIAAEHQVFANETVQIAITAFLEEVDRFTSCMSDNAGANEAENADSNEETAENGTINAYDECGPLDVTLSPGLVVSSEYASELHIE